MLKRIDSREVMEWIAYFELSAENQKMDGNDIVSAFQMKGKI